MNKTVSSVLVAIALCASSVAAFAHHGTAGTYDQKSVFRVSGVVKTFLWRNPHCILVLTGKDAEGKQADFSFEIGGPAGLARQGFSKNSFKVGDEVSFDMHPSFNNPHVGQPANRKFVINGQEMARGLDGGEDL